MANDMNKTLMYGLLAVIVMAFMIVGFLYATQTPPWQAPDEPAHYNYYAQLVECACIPIIEEGDWNAPLLEEVKAEKFPPETDLSMIEYEDHQPPLYYLVASSTQPLCDKCLFALRMFSVVLGAGLVVTAFVFVRRLLPDHPVLALSTALFVGFVPQHVAMMAAANNDSLAELLLGIIAVVAITYMGNPVSESSQPYDEVRRPHAAALGGLAGVAFWTKLTIYLPVVLAVAAAIIMRWRREGRSMKWLFEQAAWAGGMAVAIGAFWWGRNVTTYGWPDLFGLRAHDAVVTGQLRTADYLADVGTGGYIRNLLTVTYHSFWGQFGWMGVPMPSRVYAAVGVYLAWITAGIVLAWRYRDRLQLSSIQRSGLLIGLVIIGATLLNYVIYNTSFVQFQGRYLFTALIPLGLGAMLGAWGWAVLLERWVNPQITRWLPLASTLWLPMLAVYALFVYIVPNL